MIVKNKGKRLLSALVALSICVTQIVPIFAEENGGGYASGGGGGSSYASDFYTLSNYYFLDEYGDVTDMPQNRVYVRLQITNNCSENDAILFSAMYSVDGKLLSVNTNCYN